MGGKTDWQKKKPIKSFKKKNKQTEIGNQYGNQKIKIDKIRKYFAVAVPEIDDDDDDNSQSKIIQPFKYDDDN